jgi:enoyl-CoA hydratase
MSEEQAIIVERRGRVMVITLNRPEAMNAINGALSNGLWTAIQELDADDSLAAGVITGSGRAFCAGMDLKAFARGEDIGPVESIRPIRSEKSL